MKERDSSSDRRDLERKVSGLPTGPGIYQHKDDHGTVIYVGKAKNLRNRVRSYFQEGRPVDAKTKALRERIADVEVIVTDTEAEALLLENNLIKELKPKYNVLLRDDKSYPYIRITNEEYPKIFKTRRVVKDGSKYFGPYTDGTYLFYLLKSLRSILPLRSCDLPLTEATIAEGRYKVCLDYHIKKCDGPCEGYISRQQYNDYIKQAQAILTGKTKELERQLEERMTLLAEEMRFEDAAVLRTRLEKLREYQAKQKVMTSDEGDRDVFALARIGSHACTLVFTIRDGKLVGKRHFIVSKATDIEDEELLRTTVERWYVENDQTPPEVLLSVEVLDAELIVAYLKERRGRSVELITPKIGDKKRLVELAEKNADHVLREYIMHLEQKDQVRSRAVLSLQRDLRLDRMPRRIECFDNSHMQGTDYVSSMVVFVDGKPKKSEYRKYKLRDVAGNDDFEAMKEVMTRRYGAEEGPGELPDLIVIDGGKGQLSHAMEILEGLGLTEKVHVVGLAKRLEEVFFPRSSEAVVLPKTSSSLRLLQQARDEAHRFAVSYHRKLRDKRTLQSELTGINGVGERTAQKLLQTFGSVEQVKAASMDALASVVGPAIARTIFEHYHP
jgi:excinuclease ABC subunit C